MDAVKAEFYSDKSLSFKIDEMYIVVPPLLKMIIFVGPNHMETEFWLMCSNERRAIYIMESVLRAFGPDEIKCVKENWFRKLARRLFRWNMKGY